MKLLIVESPTKAKTISRFLDKTYKVKSSYGHVMDLPKSKLGIDIKNNFKPEYVVPEKAEKQVAELKKLSDKADTVILATDEDREGEAIAWHLIDALKLKKQKIERIAFHEITKKAIEKALKSPRKLDMGLVDSQQARRVLDRLVGYKLSPLLWSKIRRGLSAGRVQSVAVRLIAEREEEINKFKKQEYWKILAELEKDKQKFKAKLWKKDGKIYKKLDVENKKEAQKIEADLKKSKPTTEKITKKEIGKNPPPPFTTSTLQQVAHNVLGFSAKQTMMLAQKLYEGVVLKEKKATGLITYMRTDSLSLSNSATASAKKTIEKMYGDQYALEKPRFYKNKSKNAQEAHEAIRPTFPNKDPESIKEFLEPHQFKLYQLIWQRMIASQMTTAKIDSTTIKIKADKYHLKASGSIVKFDGYMKLTGQKNEDNILPELIENDILQLNKVLTEQKFTQPPSRYNDASLVKALEKNGIGRPSTYAPTISTIQTRGYIEKDENKKLFPTEIGLLVNQLLVKHFSEIVDYKFTAEVEDDLDDIAHNEKKWTKIIENFYKPFEKNLKMKNKEIKKEDFQKDLGRKCPDCENKLIEKFGRFGKFIACSNYPECKYTEKTKEDQAVEDKIVKQEGGKNGKITCEKCGAPMNVKNGPYGPFLGCSAYPECKNIKKVENKIGVKCPKCGKDVIEKKSKKGRVFFGCSGYPKCDFVSWSKPTGEKCPNCKSPLVHKGKDKIGCSKKECGYEKRN
ncbi:MAG: type I DNA topoisomerase [Candidatus Moranbacteria bacterium]|nr:type I DNA topoisomerase [Candidatus Moranbacteria bacterium]